MNYTLRLMEATNLFTDNWYSMLGKWRLHWSLNVNFEAVRAHGIWQPSTAYISMFCMPVAFLCPPGTVLRLERWRATGWHYNDVIMGAIASQITSLTIVYSLVYSDPDQRKHQSSASLAFVRGIHRGPVNSPHKWPVMRKMFPFDDVIMYQF